MLLHGIVLTIDVSLSGICFSGGRIKKEEKRAKDDPFKHPQDSKPNFLIS